jgi:SAM-dependent methyltransferase
MNQQRIWNYYQSARLDKFKSSTPRLLHLIRMAERVIAAGTPRILNIGIGDATLEGLAVARGWAVHALDPSAEAVDRCSGLGVEARQGQIEALPFPPDFFDAVFSSEVFEHLTAQQMEAGVSEIVRVLRPRGYLLGTVPFDERLDDQRVMCPHCGEIFHRWGHEQTFTVETMRAALSGKLQVRRIRVVHFVDWGALNWKGSGIAGVKKVLSMVGVHGTNENIVFAAQKS